MCESSSIVVVLCRRIHESRGTPHVRRAHTGNMSDPIRNLAQFLALKKSADRKFVLMLGAGASISSGVKPTAEITGELVERFAAAEPGDVEARFDRLWSGATPETRESMLKPYLDQVPSRGYRPLAELIVKGFFDVVITFNFDRLLERALEDAGFHDYKVIVRGETDLAVIDRLVEAKEPRVKILKMHGSLRSADYFLFSNEEMLNYPEEIRERAVAPHRARHHHLRLRLQRPLRHQGVQRFRGRRQHLLRQPAGRRPEHPRLPRPPPVAGPRRQRRRRPLRRLLREAVPGGDDARSRPPTAGCGRTCSSSSITTRRSTRPGSSAAAS